jgi:large subunit ribosomal protein L9
VVLHPEVVIGVTVNVARSPEEAEKQARGERVTGTAEEDEAPALEMFEEGTGPAGTGEQPDI